MSVIAEAEGIVEAPLEEAFRKFTDFRTWAAWTPRSFRPMRGPSRSLREGDRLIVRVVGLPTLLTVARVDAPREVAWTGGVPGVLHARHTLTFEAASPGGTRIRSVEEWTGVVTLSGAVGRRIQRSAEDIARAQLDGFRGWADSRRA